MRELIAAGHRRIAALANDERLWTMQERIAGYRRALAEAGLEEDPDLLLLDGVDPLANQHRASAPCWQAADPPTAIFAAHNASGRDAIRAMRAAGVDLPLIVFDETSDPNLLVSPRSSSSPTRGVRLGRSAAELALERLDGHRGPARHVGAPGRAARGAAVRSLS